LAGLPEDPDALAFLSAAAAGVRPQIDLTEPARDRA